jgi:glucosamine 6-phosphate synthetase-like amidotransferase/phosphosugar isomerase protein
MCGIIGYVGRRPCERLLLEGLRRLEYRGYDSAGLAWREGDVARCIRTVGNLDAPEAALAGSHRNGHGTIGAETSYIPTDAYAAGEMKHGPMALLGHDTPVVCVATDRRVLPKLLPNLSEVRARGARVLAIASEGCKEVAEHAQQVVYIPDTDPLLQVVLGVIPLQLFAYHIARARGRNVDQPRNLAKTVTVE